MKSTNINIFTAIALLYMTPSMQSMYVGDYSMPIQSYNTQLEEKFINAVMRGDFNKVKEFIEKDKVSVNTKSKTSSDYCYHKSVLQEAIRPILQQKAEHSQIAKYLIDNGADLNYIDKSGSSILGYVIGTSQVDLLRYMIKAGLKFTYDDILLKAATSYNDDGAKEDIEFALSHGANAEKAILAARKCKADNASSSTSDDIRNWITRSLTQKITTLRNAVVKQEASLNRVWKLRNVPKDLQLIIKNFIAL